MTVAEAEARAEYRGKGDPPAYSATATISPPDLGPTDSSVEVKVTPGLSSHGSIRLAGPRDIEGPIKAHGHAMFLGDFTVRGPIEAHGGIDLNGSLVCE